MRETNKVAGYRNMVGLYQKDVARELGISLQAYNAKENRKTDFKDSEKITFTKLINKSLPFVELSDIFFS